MFCSNCGSKLTNHGKFCSNCGAPIGGLEPNANVTTFHLSDLRVPYGTATEATLPLSEQNSDQVRLSADSELARTANAEFHPGIVPLDGELVPLNCVWAFVKHPGQIPEVALLESSIDKKFVAIGTLRGRTFEEIEAVAGPPLTMVRHQAGMNAVWGKTGFFSMWQIGLNFDPYDVCMGVYSETNV